MEDQNPKRLNKSDRKPPQPPKKTGIGTSGFGDDDPQKEKWSSDVKKGLILTKAKRAIISAVKEDGEDPDKNLLLKLAIKRAKSFHMPEVVIKNAIKTGADKNFGVHYEKIVLNVHAPGGVDMLIEGLTEDKNRSTAEIRNFLNKNGCVIANSGSTTCIFDKRGYIAINKSKADEDILMEKVLKIGADDFKIKGDLLEIICKPNILMSLVNVFEQQSLPIQIAELMMIPNLTVDLPKIEAQKIKNILNSLNDRDDVQNVYINGKFD